MKYLTGYSADRAKTQQRQGTRLAVIAEKDVSRADVQAQANLRDQSYAVDREANRTQKLIRKKKAAESRLRYQERVTTRAHNLQLTSHELKVNLNQRVNHYAKYHRCPHNNANNRVRYHSDGYEFFCDCERCIITGEWSASPAKCPSCGTFSSTSYSNLDCSCTHFKCFRCKRSFYSYINNGKPMNLFYDKHNLERSLVFLTVDGVTTIDPCFDFLVPNFPSPKVLNSRKAFLKEMGQTSTPVPMSYSTAVTPTAAIPIKPKAKAFRAPKKSVLFASVPVKESLFVKVIDLLETTAEGGAISSAIDPLVAAAANIKEKFRFYRDLALNRMQELKTNFILRNLNDTLRVVLDQVFDTFIYFINVMYDYTSVLNPALLYRLWTSRHNAPVLAMYVAEAFFHLKEFEAASRTRMLLALELDGFVTFIANYEKYEFGVLTSVLGAAIKRKGRSRNQKLNLLRNINEIGLTGATRTKPLSHFYKTAYTHLTTPPEGEATTSTKSQIVFEGDADDDDTVYTHQENAKKQATKPSRLSSINTMLRKIIDKPTKAQSGEEGLLPVILSVLSMFPKFLGKGLTFLNIFFKANMPLLMGIRAVGELPKLISRISDSIMTILYGECASTREWIELQITRKDSPIHQLMLTYLTYMTGVTSTNIIPTEEKKNMTAVRTQFYSELAACDTYVMAKERYGVPWLTFKKALTSTFDVPPTAKERDFEPVCICLSGAPGTGKSTIWPVLLSSEFLKGGEEDPLAYLLGLSYTWNSASDYQPGMSSQPIIVFDDFMQNIGEVGEALNLITLCTKAPFPINSANITGPEIKGMYAEPEAVVVCTNTTSDRAGAKLADGGALTRRYDIEFEVKRRYDPKNPKEACLTIKNCPMYGSLIGKSVDLASARMIYATVFRAKRSRYLATREVVSSLMLHPVDFEFKLSDISLDGPKAAWQGDHDFCKDMQNLVLDKIQKFDEILLDEKKEAEKPKKPLIDFSVPKGNEFVHVSKSNPGFFLMSTLKPLPDIETEPQASIPQDMLACMYSTLLTGASIGITVSAGYAFSAFMINLGKAWNTTFMVGQQPIGQGSIITYLKKIFKNLVTCAITSLTASLAMFTIYKMFSVTSSNDESGTSRTAKNPAQKVATLEQSGLPEGLSTVFEHATGSVKIRSSSKLTNCLFIGGHYILLPYHLLTDFRGMLIPDGEILDLKKFSWLDNEKSFAFERKRLIMMTGNVDAVLASAGSTPPSNIREDVCIYELSTSFFSAEKNIIKHFWDGTYEVTNMPIRKIDYIPYTLEGEHRGQIVYNDGVVTKDCIQTLRFEGNSQKVHFLAEANYAGRDASCGSMVLRTTVQERPILGIHTAVQDNKSYFHFVTRQSLEKAVKDRILIDVETKYTPSNPESSILSILPAHSVITPVGVIDKPLFQPTKTDLSPSLLQGLMGPVLTAPAPLSHKDPRINEEFRSFSAYWKQMFQGYSREAEPTFSSAELLPSSQSLIEDFKIIKSKSFVPTKLLTLHECINGLKHVPKNTRMPMDTSCGFPYVQEGLKKTDLFEEIDEILVPTARIVKDYDHAIDCLKRGTVPYLPYILSLKDERIKHSKIAEPRTRIFTCGSVIGYLVCRRYFYSALMQYYHADIHDSFCVPSLDRTSFDWHYLSKRMTEVGNRGFDFDFSHYDRSLTHQILYYSVKVLLTGLNLPPLEEAAVMEMICSPTLIWGRNVMLGSFLTSGVLITFLLNCVANELMHRTAWTALFKKDQPILSEMRFYKTYTRPCRGGDDTMTTVDERVLPIYNGRTVAEYLRSRGMKVTSATKSQEIPESSHYCDLSFLKNTTRYHRGMFLPVSELSSLYESTYWVRLSAQNNDILKATQDNAICAMRPLFFHGEEVFNAFRNAALEKVPRLTLPTYENLSDIWNSYHCFPGSHSDFASRELQDDPFTNASNLIPFAADEGSNSNMSFLDTTPQSGLGLSALDKEKIGSAKVERGSVHEEISVISDETIDNRDAGATDKTTAETVGTSIQDAAGTKAKPVKTGNLVIQSKNMRAEVYMNDVNWDLERLVKKFTAVKFVRWTTADPANHELTSISTPLGFLVTPAQRKPFEVTKYWKGTVWVKLVIKASPFYAGCIAAGFSPLGVTPSLPRLINMGAVIHKLSQEEGIEFTIPFRWHQGFINTAVDSLGQFCIYVVSPLRTGPDNANSIDIAVYASITDSEFKLPDTIPAVAYNSHKFPLITTHPQSSTQVTSATCDVNSLPTAMPSCMMCAGEGTVGSPEVSHFQDTAVNLVELLKRFELTSVGSYNIPADSVVTARFSVLDIAKSAMRGFDRAFGLYRGSFNLRFFMEVEQGNAKDSVHGQLSLSIIQESITPGTNSQNPNNSGYQVFNVDDMGMVTIPWIFPTFVAFTPITGQLDGNAAALKMNIFNNNTAAVDVTIRVDIAVGDDFHLGLYVGGPRAFTLYDSIPLIPSSISTEAIVYDYKYPAVPPLSRLTLPNIPTRPQSGMLQFVERAIENTLPLIEVVSKLGLELDAHMMTEQSQLVQQRKRPFSANTDLPVMTERLLTLNHNGMSLPDHSCFGSDMSESDIKNLLTQTKSLNARFEWTEAHPTGTRLVDFWAGPDAPNGEDGDIHAKIPGMFNYYTGGTVLIFDVQSTVMHRGQLLLSYKPVSEASDAQPVNFGEATQTYFTTLDLSSGRATVAVILPYLSPRPQTSVAHIDEPRSFVNSTGVLSVFVQNALRSTATVAPGVQVIVYKCFSPDFQLGVYGSTPWSPVAFASDTPIRQLARRPLIRSTLPSTRQ